MFKRIVSCLIIFSMLWVDIVAAMDDEKNPPPSIYPHLPLPIKKTNSSDSLSTHSTKSSLPTERSSLLKVDDQQDVYRTITPLQEITSSQHTIQFDSSSNEDLYPSPLQNLQDPLEESGVKSKICPCWPPSCCKKKPVFIVDKFDSDEESSGSSGKTCCWPPSCLPCGKKKPVDREEDVESIDRNNYLVIAERGPSLVELKKQALLAFVPLLKEESKKIHVSSDVISLEKQPLDDEEILLQKALALAEEMKGTPLEDFGNWFKGHVLDNRYTWKDWGGLVIALCMAAGTGSAMSDIVEYSIYNSFFANHLKEYMPIVKPLARYINVSTALTSLVDSASFMPEATSPSTRTFTIQRKAQEKRADRILIPLAAISGIYLLLLHFIVTQAQKKFNGETGWWNSPDQVLYFSSLGFFPYLVAQSWKGMRTAVSRVFHPTVPEHVKERVLALRQLDARLDSYSDEALDNLYDLLKHPLLAQNAKFKAWARYFCKGEIADEAKVEGLLTYLSLTKYAQEHFKEEVDSEEDGHKTRKAARILASLGLPAGFSLVAISVFGLFSAFMGWQGALALSITAATLGFLPESFLQAHNVQETLDDITAKTSGKQRGWKEAAKDPYWWGAKTAKVLGLVWSAFHNILTSLAPIFVSLVMLIPQELEGSDTAQKAMTWTMIAFAIPYLISELISGTHDMWGHLGRMAYAVHDFCYGIYDRIVACCKKEVTLSPRRQKREIRRILGKTIATTLHLSPQFVENLDEFERKVNEKETF